MVLKLYIDPMSQPARALMLFVRATRIPAEEITVAFMKNEHKTEEYAQVNRFQKVPAMIHDDFKLSESIAILRYLARAFQVPDHWYPTDLRAQARVDEFMSWHHIGLRLPILNYFLSFHITHRLGPIPPTASEIENYKCKMESALKDFQTKWLSLNTDFVAGDKISIADLLAVGEIEMTRTNDYNVASNYPEIGVYLNKVRDAVGPEIYDQVHTELLQFQDSLRATTSIQ